MQWEEFRMIFQEYIQNCDINEDTKILDDLGMDSFQMMGIVMMLENKGMQLNFDRIEKMQTVKDLFYALGGND